MKSIIISIKPKYVAKILNGEKTIEVRKRFPKDYKGWVYIYCTKGNDILTDNGGGKYYLPTKDVAKNIKKNRMELNGKVVARFYCDKVEEITCYEHYEPPCDIGIAILAAFTCNAYNTNTLEHFELLEKAWLKDLSIAPSYHEDELDLYLKGKNGYAIHISQLEIFDNPKELSEFYPSFITKEKFKKIYKVDEEEFENVKDLSSILSLQTIKTIIRNDIEVDIMMLNSGASYISSVWFNNKVKESLDNFKLTKAPKNYCYIETE